MIVVKLMGGLGNQLFQYAAAKTLAARHHTQLRLDLSFLNSDPRGQHTQRYLELQAFNLQLHIAGENDLQPFLQPTRFQRLIGRLVKPKAVVAHEKGFAYQNSFLSLPADTYLDGFWQSEKYFKQLRPLLLEELSLKQALPAACNDLKVKLDNANSVSLHIRRGDYVSLKSASDYHGVLPMAYYEQAVAYLNARFPDLTLFVFSDDLSWAKENLRLPNPMVFVECTAGTSHANDLFLMSLCRHNIIANSSFSWWGAWLNRHADKTVIAPVQWFKNETIDTSDLIPESWIRLR